MLVLAILLQTNVAVFVDMRFNLKLQVHGQNKSEYGKMPRHIG